MMIWSCREKKQIDVKQPVIESVHLNGDDTTVIFVDAGDIITLDVSVSDNSALNQLLLNIHPAEDEHTHSGAGHAGGEGRLNSGKWGKEEIVNLSGTSHTHTWQLEVPDTVGGNWHATLSLIDDVGNSAIPYTILIHVANSNLPVITGSTVPAEDATQTIYMQQGGQLTVDGEALDPDILDTMFVHMMWYNGFPGDTLAVPITGAGTGMAFQGLSFNGAVEGTYRIVIEAFDTLGYHGIWDRKVIVGN